MDQSYAPRSPELSGYAPRSPDLASAYRPDSPLGHDQYAPQSPDLSALQQPQHVFPQQIAVTPGFGLDQQQSLQHQHIAQSYPLQQPSYPITHHSLEHSVPTYQSDLYQQHFSYGAQQHQQQPIYQQQYSQYPEMPVQTRNRGVRAAAEVGSYNYDNRNVKEEEEQQAWEAPPQQQQQQQQQQQLQPPLQPQLSIQPQLPLQQQQQQQTQQQPPTPARRGRKPKSESSNGASAPSPMKKMDTGGIEVKTKFPTARIKRIMQADEDVGKVAQVTPVVMAKALELFMIRLISASAGAAKTRGSKRVLSQHMKAAVMDDEQFDNLRDIMSKVPDAPTKGANGDDSEDEDSAPKKGAGRGRKAGVGAGGGRGKKRRDSDDF